MLKTLKIKNFQSHKDTTIEFSPYVNIICGSSNSGKTAILRALNWIINNRPLGTGFIRKGTQEVKVELIVGRRRTQTSIVRLRDKKNNCYLLGDSKFKALGADVPQEIRNVLDFDEINIQEQLSPYFLVLDTPGEVAERINEVTKLNEIDAIVTLIAKKIRENSSEIAEVKLYINRCTLQLKDIEKLHLDDYENILSKSEQIVGMIRKIGGQYDALLNLRGGLERIRVEKNKLPKDCEKLISKCDKIVSEYEGRLDRYNRLAGFIDSIGEITEKLREGKVSLSVLTKQEQLVLSELVNCPACGMKLDKQAKTVLLRQ